MQKKGIYLEEADSLLRPGYLDLETGYARLPDGQIYVAVLSRMPGCKGKMIDWWFGTGLKDTSDYRRWEPHDHLYLKWDNRWEPGKYIGASHLTETLMAGVRAKITIRFYDPAEWFDLSKFKEANIGAAICGEGYLPDGTLDGRLVHLVRDTNFGCEIRSRIWIAPGPEEIAKGHMEHCISEMGYLADFLPGLYQAENGHNNHSKPE